MNNQKNNNINNNFNKKNIIKEDILTSYNTQRIGIDKAKIINNKIKIKEEFIDKIDIKEKNIYNYGNKEEFKKNNKSEFIQTEKNNCHNKNNGENIIDDKGQILNNNIKYIINDEEEESNISKINNENINFILDEDNNSCDIKNIKKDNIDNKNLNEDKSKNSENQNDSKNYIEYSD